MSWDDVPQWSTTVATAILQAVKEKDAFTFYHCCRVGRASRRLAQAMGLNEFEQAVLEYSGLFHDVGKVGIPDSVLLKPGKLDTPEVEIMKAHPLKSVQIIEPLAENTFFKQTLPGVKHHHEKIDGTGYPFGLEGDKIPLAARIIAVVDTFDAMSYTRPYRKGLPLDKVKQELIDYSGTQFDAYIVQIFLKALPFWLKDLQKESQEDELIVDKILKAA